MSDGEHAVPDRHRADVRGDTGGDRRDEGTRGHLHGPAVHAATVPTGPLLHRGPQGDGAVVICGPCSSTNHDKCKGKKERTWCDCQHKVRTLNDVSIVEVTVGVT